MTVMHCASSALVGCGKKQENKRKKVEESKQINRKSTREGRYFE